MYQYHFVNRKKRNAIHFVYLKNFIYTKRTFIQHVINWVVFKRNRMTC